MRRRAVVVSFDHLHPGFLGCGGNDWIETPNLDRLAAAAVVFDQHFCENLDPAAVNHAWWTGRHQFPLNEEHQRRCPSFIDELHSCGVHTCLIVEADGGDESKVAPPFEDVVTARGTDGFDVVESETPFARLVARCGEWLDEAADRTGPALLWIKSRGVPAPWVPPRAFAELYLADFGLAEDGGSPRDVADEEAEAGASSGVPADDGPPEDERDGAIDSRYAAAMYAAYVTLVDRWLGRLLEELRESPEWNDALLIVTAAWGQSLGENGTIDDEAPRLLSEAAQTPLWIQVPGSDQGCTRRQDLVQAIDLPHTLREWFGVAGTDLDPETGPAALLAGRSLLPLIRNEPVAPREFVVLGNGRMEWGIRTPDFYYVEPGDSDPDPEASPARLFEKPHDRWDQSDVLAQYPQIAEELRAALHREIEVLTARSTGFSRAP